MPDSHEVIVFAGGDPPPEGVRDDLPADAMVIAADSGADLADRWGVPVQLLVGDLDSVDPRTLDRLVAAGTAVERHPTDKDRTDLELALDAGMALGAERMVVVGGAGGRLDHLFGNVSVLTSSSYRRVHIDAFVGAARLHVAHGRRQLPATAGELVTLLAVHGRAEGVEVSGVRWELSDASLESGSSRGVSNEVVSGSVVVSVVSGTLLVVFPGVLAP